MKRFTLFLLLTLTLLFLFPYLTLWFGHPFFTTMTWYWFLIAFFLGIYRCFKKDYSAGLGFIMGDLLGAFWVYIHYTESLKV